jgi:hypothetical protein
MIFPKQHPEQASHLRFPSIEPVQLADLPFDEKAYEPVPEPCRNRVRFGFGVSYLLSRLNDFLNPGPSQILEGLKGGCYALFLS